jgi:segregation and condensation protein B
MSKAEKNTNAQPALTEDMRILEALLFASDDILTPAKIKKIMPGEPDVRRIRKMIEEINAHLQRERHPFEIVELGGGYQFRTVAYYHPWLRKLLQERTVKKLSIQALECLAIIAYKQPLSKAEIEAIRGVLSDGAMKTLLERKLVTVGGRSDKPGRPLLYVTTPQFLRYFGINKLDDLPSIEEFEAIAREKMEEISEEAFADMEQATGIAPAHDRHDGEEHGQELTEESERVDGEAGTDHEESVEHDERAGEEASSGETPAPEQSSDARENEAAVPGESPDEAFDILGESGSDENPSAVRDDEGERDSDTPPEAPDTASTEQPLLEEEADLAEDSEDGEEEEERREREEFDDSLVDEPSVPTRLIEPSPGEERIEEEACPDMVFGEDEEEGASSDTIIGEGEADPADILGEGVPADEETQVVPVDEFEGDEPLPDDETVTTREIDLPEGDESDRHEE